MATARAYALPDVSRSATVRSKPPSSYGLLESRRIALCLPSLEAGGAERVMLSLARGFADRGFLVDLVPVKAHGTYLREVPPGVRSPVLVITSSLGPDATSARNIPRPWVAATKKLPCQNSSSAVCP